MTVPILVPLLVAGLKPVNDAWGAFFEQAEWLPLPATFYMHRKPTRRWYTIGAVITFTGRPTSLARGFRTEAYKFELQYGEYLEMLRAQDRAAGIK